MTRSRLGYTLTDEMIAAAFLVVLAVLVMA